MGVNLVLVPLCQNCARIQVGNVFLLEHFCKSTCPELCQNCAKILSVLAFGVSF
jgi:hypothetical protein